MIQELAIFGAGSFGREVAGIVDRINQIEPRWKIVGFYDNIHPVGEVCEYGRVLGNVDAIADVTTPLAMVIAIGEPAVIKAVRNRITNPLITFPNIIDPLVDILHPASVRFGEGNIVANKCVFTVDVTIGDFNIFNGDIGVGHGTTIGNCNAIMPGVQIADDVRVGDYNLIGMRAGVMTGVKIGNETRIGAGSIIDSDTVDGHLYMGNPARSIYSPPDKNEAK